MLSSVTLFVPLANVAMGELKSLFVLQYETIFLVVGRFVVVLWNRALTPTIRLFCSTIHIESTCEFRNSSVELVLRICGNDEINENMK